MKNIAALIPYKLLRSQPAARFMVRNHERYPFPDGIVQHNHGFLKLYISGVFQSVYRHDNPVNQIGFEHIQVFTLALDIAGGTAQH